MLPIPSAARLRSVALIAFIAALIYIPNSFFPALLDDADAGHAVVSSEMLRAGRWGVLYMNGIRWPMKAPLHYWAVAASYAVFGENEFATRLPLALAVILLAVAVHRIGARFLGPRAALYGGLIAATSAGVFLFTRIMLPDAIFALELTILFGLFLAGWMGAMPRRRAYISAWAMAGAAVLTRGLLGIAFPLGVIGAYLLVTRSLRRLRELELVRGGLVFVVISVPWHVLAEIQSPGFLWAYFINEHVLRAVGTRYPPDYTAVPLGIWLAAHAVWLFPWSVFAPLAVLRLPALFRQLRARQLSPAGQTRVFLWVWTALILTFFSFTASRMEYYAFGAWPAMGLLIADAMAEAEADRGRWLRALQAALAGIGLAVAAVLAYFVWRSRGIDTAGDISRYLRLQDADLYRVSMAHLLDLTSQAFAFLRAPAIGAALVFSAGLAIPAVLRLRRKHVAAAIATAAAMVMFFFCANLAYATFGPYLSSRTLAEAINRRLRDGDRVAIYGEFYGGSSIAYYTHRRTWIVDGRVNNLEPGSYFPDAPRIFLDRAGLEPFWRDGRRVFLFVPPGRRAEALKVLPPGATYVLAESGGKAVLTNFPPHQN